MSKAEKEVFKEELHCGGGCVWVGVRRLAVLGCAAAAAAACSSRFQPDTRLPDQTILHQPIQVNTAISSSSYSSSSYKMS